MEAFLLYNGIPATVLIHRLGQGEGKTEGGGHDVEPGDIEKFAMTIIMGNFYSSVTQYGSMVRHRTKLLFHSVPF